MQQQQPKSTVQKTNGKVNTHKMYRYTLTQTTPKMEIQIGTSMCFWYSFWRTFLNRHRSLSFDTGEKFMLCTFFSYTKFLSFCFVHRIAFVRFVLSNSTQHQEREREKNFRRWIERAHEFKLFIPFSLCHTTYTHTHTSLRNFVVVIIIVVDDFFLVISLLFSLCSSCR